MRDLNELTKKLIEEGYTEENHPDWVRPFKDFYGGFTYDYKKLCELIFETPCGLLIKGSHFWGEMSFGGVNFTPENNNPATRCPYDKVGCELNHELLRDLCMSGRLPIVQCACHLTGKEFDYQKSVEMVWDERAVEEKRLYDEFAKRKKGHCCRSHMYFNQRGKKWEQQYDPMKCAKECYNQTGICDLTKRPLSTRRGNVFYDIKKTSYRHEGGLFDGEEIVSIIKGNRLLSNPRSLTICEEIAKRCRPEIEEKVNSKYYREMFFCPDTKIEVLNIRAESRESRDLLQDLKDIKDGIEVIHQTDLEKAAKQQKSERRKNALESKKMRLKNKILKYGLDEMEAVDRKRALKFLGPLKVGMIEHTRIKQQSVQENANETQLKIF
jgi:hypothetical protein